MAIYQDLVAMPTALPVPTTASSAMRKKPPMQIDRLSFLHGKEMQVDYGKGALSLVPGTADAPRYKKTRLYVATLRHSDRNPINNVG